MRHLVLFLTLLLIIVLLPGCALLEPEASPTATESVAGTPAGETATAAPSPTPEATVVTPTMAVTATEPPTPTTAPTVAPTATVAPTKEPTALPPAEVYGFQVSYALDDVEPEDPAAGPPAGEKWIVIVTAIQNNSNQPVTITQESITLIDESGERYSPDEPDEETQPPLIGARLEPGDNLLGLVRFTTPDDTQPATLEWCSRGPAPCSDPLTSPVP